MDGGQDESGRYNVAEDPVAKVRVYWAGAPQSTQFCDNSPRLEGVMRAMKTKSRSFVRAYWLIAPFCDANRCQTLRQAVEIGARRD